MTSPQSVKAVWERACCLWAINIRVHGEMAIAVGIEPPPPRLPSGGKQDIASWFVEYMGVEKAVTRVERRLHDTPRGKWTPAEVLQIGWRRESLGVLCCALRAIRKMPRYDERFKDGALYTARKKLFFSPRDDARHQLRSPEDLARAREVAELWRWRLGLPQGADFREKLEAAADRRLVKLVAGDLQAMGRPVGALEGADRKFVESVVAERAHAFAWMSGELTDWDGGPGHGKVPAES